MIDQTRAMILVAAGLLAGCAATSPEAADPLADLQNPKLPVSRRAAAIDRAWMGADAGERRELRSALKSLAWSVETPAELRLGALRRVIEDPAEDADSRAMARLMIPREPDLAVVGLLAHAAAARGWVDVSPSLVRSLSRRGKGADEERPERAALLRLNPGLTIEEIAFGVFVRPETGGGSGRDGDWGKDEPMRTRMAAWNLLSRLDADGSRRAGMLASGPPPDPLDAAGQRTLDDLRACLNELRTVPITAEELKWLTSLRRPSDSRNSAWWKEAAAAVGALTEEQAGGLRLRHAEAVRWASAHRASWLSQNREGLISDLSARLRDRRLHPRSQWEDRSSGPVSERLSEWADRISWGDALSILVIDEALRGEALAGSLFEQVEADLADRTTEYGGLLQLPPPADGAVLYPPRPSERLGDDQFVASTDMMEQGDRSAAHYHFHAGRARNASYSGPSAGDLAYAEALGRSCLVFTSLRPGVLAVDYYQPGGVVIDLGEIRAAAKR